MTGPADEQRSDLLAGLDLRALLLEVTERVQGVARLADRLQSLLSAVVSIGSHLELPELLERITQTAAELSNAKYAALGVVDPTDQSALSQFITLGVEPGLGEAIGELPHGRGVLGLLIREPRAIRLANLADHPASHGFPPSHPPMRTFLGVPISVRGEAFGNLYLTEKRGGSDFTEADEQIVTALASAAGLAIANARLYDRARRRQHWLEATGAIQTRLLSGADPDEVLSDLVSVARRLAEGDLAFLALPTQGGELTVRAADGNAAEVLFRGTIPAESLAATVMRTGEPTVVRDATTDPRIWPGLLERTNAGPAVYVPLGDEESRLGTLVVTRAKDAAGFDDETMRLIESFAGQAAIALRLTAAAGDREQLALLGDRDRIARDLHDLVIQRLFAVGMSLEGAVRGIQPPEQAQRVRRAVDDLDDTIKEIRTTIFALHSPAPLTGDGVRAVLLSAVATVHDTLGFAPSLTFTGPVDTLVPPQTAEQMLAVLREALSNVARHAGASAVAITVTADNEGVELVVTDDGKGLPKSGRRSGLANLAERAADLGGRFSVSPGEQGGTVLRWQVPLS